MNTNTALAMAGVAVVAVAVGVVAGLTLVGGPADVADDPESVATPTATRTTTPTPTATPRLTTVSPTTTPAPTPTATPEGPVSRASVEYYIHQRMNFHRASYGYDDLPVNASLREVARYHSENMAEEGYVGHKGPDGEQLIDRLDRFEVDCTSSTETVGRVPFDTPVDSRDGGVVRYDTPEKVAKAIVREWMRGETSRSKILRIEWTQVGIGVAVGEGPDGYEVYATLDLCEM